MMGYGSRSRDKVLSLLKNNEIELVIDIRRWPTSKREGFKKEELEKWLNENGIKYVWMGDLLGGYRNGGFEKYMKSKDFKEGIKKLLEFTLNQKTCLLCLEEDIKACHRRFIAEYLKSMGLEIINI